MDEQAAFLEYLKAAGIDTPEKLQAFMQTGQTPELLGMANQDYATGQGLSQTPSAQGQNVGNTYVAASPLEHLATALGRYQGGKQMQGARDQQNALIKALVQANAQKFQAKSGGPGMFAPQAQPQVPQSPQMLTPEELGFFGPGY
jgi:hypothetical protein